MDCEESKNLITISIYGKLTQTEKSQLEEHLRECSRCAKIFEKTGKLSSLFNEQEDIPFPDKEKSWQIISAKAVRKKDRDWFERLAPRKPVYQFSFALLLLVVGFAAGYFIRSNWQSAETIAQLRQEVLQIRQITAASLLRQESLNNKLREMGMSSLGVQQDQGTLGSLFRAFRGETDANLRPSPIDDPYSFLTYPEVRQDSIKSLSEQTSPLVEIALAIARYIEQLKLN